MPIQDTENAEALTDVALLDVKIAEAEMTGAEAKSSVEERKAREKIEDLKRLKRIEVIYVSNGLGVTIGC